MKLIFLKKKNNILIFIFINFKSIQKNIKETIVCQIVNQ